MKARIFGNYMTNDHVVTASILPVKISLMGPFSALVWLSLVLCDLACFWKQRQKFRLCIPEGQEVDDCSLWVSFSSLIYINILSNSNIRWGTFLIWGLSGFVFLTNLSAWKPRKNTPAFLFAEDSAELLALQKVEEDERHPRLPEAWAGELPARQLSDAKIFAMCAAPLNCSSGWAPFLSRCCLRTLLELLLPAPFDTLIKPK